MHLNCVWRQSPDRAAAAVAVLLEVFPDVPVALDTDAGENVAFYMRRGYEVMAREQSPEVRSRARCDAPPPAARHEPVGRAGP
jgi:hypothetical protein